MAQSLRMSFFVLLFTALVVSIRPVSALPDDRQYQYGDYIPLFANKVNALNDPCEARSYFELPFCPPGNSITNRKKSFEEVLEGDCFTNTQYELEFKVEKIGETLCEKNLTKDEVAKFRYAVKNKFEFHMYYNNIPMRGIVGIVEARAGSFNSRPKYYLVKHIRFHAHYIGNQVKDIYARSDFDSAVDITDDAGIKVNFTYSVFWSELKFNLANSDFWNETSMDEYRWPTEQQGRWEIILYHIFWAAVIFFWVGSLLAVTVPYLRGYFARYADGDVEEGRGKISLKQIHGDACRCPTYSSLLGAILGIGTQHLILICSLFALAFKGFLYSCDHEALFTYLLLIYCLTSAVSGYTATSFHCRYTAVGWKECVFQTGVLYFVPAFLTFVLINRLADMTYGFSDLPQFSTTVVLLLIWGLGTIIFLSLGGKIGYAFRFDSQAPCSTSRIQREIPQLCWYMKTPAQMFLGGLLPFITIFQEMDSIYASLWYYKACGAFYVMFKNFIVVIALTIIVGMVFTYYQLYEQDHQWWWRSVLRGGSTAIFMFTYGIYFQTRTNPHDFTKLFIFLGYNACIFYAVFLILGTIGFWASSIVFRRMYQGAQKNE